MGYYSLTDIGMTRKINEDSYENLINDKVKLFVVADGMGGHNAGEVASAIAVYCIKIFVEENYDKYENPFDLLKEAIQYSNSKIYEESLKNDSYSNMGTTVVLAYVVEDNLFVANVGDSRCYLKNNYGFKQISKDHSLVNDLLSNGTITEEEAKTYIQRNVVTRSLGIEDTVEPECIMLSLEKGDIVLLCSDGLNSMISDEHIEEIISDNTSLQEKCEDLIDESNDNGGNDNITITIYQHGVITDDR